MRIMLFFDLPTKTKNERKQYTKFRKFLINNGYVMVQFSVYSRFCRNYASINKHINRINENIPKKGEIRYMIVTEKQYFDMQVMNNEFTVHEKKISSNPVIEV